ncbi:glutathione S-transferase [Rhodophyticola porphyridii]|uniref:Glutathione S-transferase n=1 Tax=Rhodophyticola porphyridii TaxID=1852017 RepID=A0A3L9Y7M7_9RHOB|nr:glutathione S-transferase [Rhodophyticola porphyridii]RMA43475.1 glutathione S-transferase [Rhodophyticola porphyridii]
MPFPILYSFRRCPYAIRARLAIASAGVRVALREVVLRSKPEAFLAASPSATVPCLVKDDGESIDESLDIMLWALERNDPESLLEMPNAGMTLIAQCDGPFKSALDHTKYASRHPDLDAEAERAQAMAFIVALDARLDGSLWIFGETPSLADLAILPFIRQFAMIDKTRFDAEAGADVRRWLDGFLVSERLAAVMAKHPQWAPGDAEIAFPG